MSQPFASSQVAILVGTILCSNGKNRIGSKVANAFGQAGVARSCIEREGKRSHCGIKDCRFARELMKKDAIGSLAHGTNAFGIGRQRVARVRPAG